MPGTGKPMHEKRLEDEKPRVSTQTAETVGLWGMSSLFLTEHETLELQAVAIYVSHPMAHLCIKIRHDLQQVTMKKRAWNNSIDTDQFIHEGIDNQRSQVA